MKMNFGKALSLVVGCFMILSVTVSAASSTSTISNSQSSATGNYIYTGSTVPISGTLGVKCSTVKANAAIKADAMKIIEYWPDSSIGSCQTAGSTLVTTSVSLSTANNAYYLKLSQAGSVYTDGIGSLGT